MAEDDRPLKDWDLFVWLTSGPWWHRMPKFLTPVIVVMILFCLFAICLVPCFKSMISKAMSNTLILHTQDQQQEEDDEETSV